MVDILASNPIFDAVSRSERVVTPVRLPAHASAASRSPLAVILDAISILSIFAGGYLALLLT